MNRSIAWALALLLTGFVPVSQAQDDLVYFQLGTDAEGDTDGVATENPWKPLDMVSLSVAESDAGFHFLLGLAGLDVDMAAVESQTGTGIEEQLTRGVDYYIEFHVKGEEYRLNLYYIDEPRETYGSLARVNSDGWWEYLQEFEVEVDEANVGLSFTLPHGWLANENGVEPRIGDTISNFRADSYSTGPQVVNLYTFGTIVDGSDNFPDDWQSYMPGTWDVQTGVVSTGTIDAWSELPVRVSNGEATTFLYEMQVHNTADFVDTVIPSWSGGLDSWIVTFPTGKMRLAPDETKTIPFLVTVPFSHEHGVYHPFTVAFQSQADPLSTGLVELGVRYTAIPQPAGHHPEVYLHATDSRPYFNTIKGENYPEGAEETGTSSSGGCGSSRYYTQLIPMSPSLEMGMDFDMDSLGEAEWLITSESQSDGYQFSAYFVVSSERPNTCVGSNPPTGAVAYVEPTGPISLAGGQSTSIKSPIVPLEGGDYVLYEPSNQLWLLVIRHYPENALPFSGFADVGVPELMDDTSFFLPLKEYHDDVDDYFDALSGIDLYSVGSQERYVNPGEAIIYRLVAQNIGIEPVTLNLELTGSNVGWASLLGSTQIKLKPGEERDLALMVRAPTGTVDGELADVTLHANLQSDESVRSLIRLLSEVDTDADHLDEGAEAAILDGELQQAPAPFLLAPLAMAALAILRRRQ